MSDDFALARYNSDGSLDLSFGSGGKVSTDFFDSQDLAHAVVIQSDGRIVVAGRIFSSITSGDFGVVRYNTDGSLDTAFGYGGKVTTDFFGFSDSANAIALQGDNKIVVGGSATDINGTFDDFAIVRYNPDGSLEGSFGTGGKITTAFSVFTDGIRGITVQTDGKIVAAGSSFQDATNFDFALARYEGTSFDTCLQDDSNGNLLQINTTTGDYQFSNCSGFTFSGTGSLMTRGCTLTLQDTRHDRRVVARIDTCQNRATASIQVFTQGMTITISDRNTTNNSCSCNQ
jgi:uncharacterized delta-60 repeat protein